MNFPLNIAQWSLLKELEERSVRVKNRKNEPTLSDFVLSKVSPVARYEVHKLPQKKICIGEFSSLIPGLNGLAGNCNHMVTVTSNYITSHSAYDATLTQSNRVKIDGVLCPNFM